MATAQSGAAANDATVRTTTGRALGPEDVKRKAEAAVGYCERSLDAAKTGVANGEAKVTKVRGLLAGAETSLAEAREAEQAEARNLAAARAYLAELGG